MSGDEFNPAQKAAIRRRLGSPPIPDERVGDAILALLDAEEAVAGEWTWIRDGAELGYVHGQFVIEDVPQRGT